MDFFGHRIAEKLWVMNKLMHEDVFLAAPVPFYIWDCLGELVK